MSFPTKKSGGDGGGGSVWAVEWQSTAQLVEGEGEQTIFSMLGDISLAERRTIIDFSDFNLEAAYSLVKILVEFDKTGENEFRLVETALYPWDFADRLVTIDLGVVDFPYRVRLQHLNEAPPSGVEVPFTIYRKE
jgi:hypothetical protein